MRRHPCIGLQTQHVVQMGHVITSIVRDIGPCRFVLRAEDRGYAVMYLTHHLVVAHCNDHAGTNGRAIGRVPFIPKTPKAGLDAPNSGNARV
jgi:hypothetical protein